MQPLNPNLTPTVVTDRNGKVTTVHKRTQALQKTSPSVPAPVIQSVNPSTSLERVTTMVASRSYRGGPRNMESVVKLHTLLADDDTGEVSLREQMFIARMNNNETDAVIGALESHDGFRTMLKSMHDEFSLGQIAGFAAVYEPDLFILPSHVAVSDEEKVQSRIQLLGKSYGLLRRHQILGSDYEATNNLSTLSVEAQERAKSFFRVCTAMEELNADRKTRRGIIEFAMDPAHDTKDVIAAMWATGSIDPVVLRGVMNGMETSVAEGWL